MAQQTSFTSSETTLPFSLGPSSPTNDAVAAMPIVPHARERTEAVVHHCAAGATAGRHGGPHDA